MAVMKLKTEPRDEKRRIFFSRVFTITLYLSGLKKIFLL